MNQDIARAAYYAAREAAEAAYHAYVAARRKGPRKGGILIANKLTAAANAYAAAASVYFSALDGAAAAEASKSRYDWYRSAPGISSRAHDIVQWTDPTPWCNGCGSMTRKGCDCGPIADNN